MTGSPIDVPVHRVPPLACPRAAALDGACNATPSGAHLYERDCLERDAGVLDTYALHWLRQPELKPNTLVVGPISVAASAEAVWQIVKQVDRYGELSGGALTAGMAENKPVAPGNLIVLGVHAELSGLKKLIFAGQLRRSVETVTVVDDRHKAICWQRNVPLSCGEKSERWQVVVPVSDRESLYYTGLYTPGWVGAVSSWAVGDGIRGAFEAVIQGIKAEAEHNVRRQSRAGEAV